MAETLKSRYGPEVPRRIASMLRAVHPRFPADAFLADALDGYEALELMPRGRKIAAALERHLPADYEEAVALLVASMGPKLGAAEGHGMSPFLYMPHSFFIAERGLDHFEASMNAQYELTQRFTAEFCVRPFLERHQDATLARLARWAEDPSEHVRRLVSEGTRPRLPWAPRLRAFQADPRPVLALLERLKDDPSLYVRRSVANNLNDVGKDHPAVLTAVARRWLEGASPERRWIVGHALRSALKRGEPGALAALGFGKAKSLRVKESSVTPARARIGGKIEVAFTVVNAGRVPARTLADFRIHFVKADGGTAPKVFKLKALELAPGARARLRKTVSLAQHTTRRHYPGIHRVEALLDGRAFPLGRFDLR
ncbi:MAG: DNA alkylation repair protein [Elusimicrobiota bacterium]|nr:DNA alkylation repair protein [Elusimicrobiota bacterium]